jgi:hypothetical protein
LETYLFGLHYQRKHSGDADEGADKQKRGKQDELELPATPKDFAELEGLIVNAQSLFDDNVLLIFSLFCKPKAEFRIFRYAAEILAKAATRIWEIYAFPLFPAPSLSMQVEYAEDCARGTELAKPIPEGMRTAISDAVPSMALGCEELEAHWTAGGQECEHCPNPTPWSKMSLAAFLINWFVLHPSSCSSSHVVDDQRFVILSCVNRHGSVKLRTEAAAFLHVLWSMYSNRSGLARNRYLGQASLRNICAYLLATDVSVRREVHTYPLAVFGEDNDKEQSKQDLVTAVQGHRQAFTKQVLEAFVYLLPGHRVLTRVVVEYCF